MEPPEPCLCADRHFPAQSSPIRSGRLGARRARAFDANHNSFPGRSGREAAPRAGVARASAHRPARRRGSLLLSPEARLRNGGPQPSLGTAAGEIDLIGRDGEVLCFIEVKTRTSHDVKPAEAAVDRDKRRELAGMARDYLRHAGNAPQRRFDVVSIYFESASPSPQIELFKNAFSVA